MKNFKKGFFITGTDTNIGKTVVSSILVNKLNANYWKPIQCGKENGLMDSDLIKKVLRIDDSRIIKEKFFLKAPISPNLASNIEKKKISTNHFKIGFYKEKKPLIVEGAGGIMVPINKKEFVVDIIRIIKLPVILVASTKLGTINHTLLSIESLHNRRLKIFGIIFVGDDNKETMKTIESFFFKITKKKISFIFRVPILKKIDLASINRISKLIVI